MRNAQRKMNSPGSCSMPDALLTFQFPSDSLTSCVPLLTVTPVCHIVSDFFQNSCRI